MKLKEKQLELEKSQQEAEKRKNDAFFNVMSPMSPTAITRTATNTVDYEAFTTKPSYD